MEFMLTISHVIQGKVKARLVKLDRETFTIKWILKLIPLKSITISIYSKIYDINKTCTAFDASTSNFYKSYSKLYFIEWSNSSIICWDLFQIW